MSFQKNPPWQKNVGMPQFQQQMSLQQLNQMGFLNQINQAQAQHFAPNAQPMMMNQLVNQVSAVQYPQARVNPMAFQQQPSPQQSSNQAIQQQQQQQQSKYANQKVFSGTGQVTKIQNDIGFIDDEVLFHKNVCVKGMSPKIGDRVLVEAAYNQNMPFKWNATRVQVLTRANVSTSSGGGSSQLGLNKSHHVYSSVPPPRESSTSTDGYRSSRRFSPERRKSPDRRPRSRDRRDTDHDKRTQRPRERESPVRHSRDRSSPIRKPSPKRRCVRYVPRYMVQIPKISLTQNNADIVEIKKRYQNLYIPSDFFKTEVKWIEAFPPNAPFSIKKPCSFHVMHKDVSMLDENDAVLDPPDADYLYSAKVMLMATPPIEDIYKRCAGRAEDSDPERVEKSERDFIHPTRLINFLVGLRGKNETMAIGGAWSKKLDGENPQSDPTVLIRTAIRTTKALTGIDLSNCTQWYRFVELYYRRSEQTKDKGQSSRPARIETVVIFLPDITSCMPNQLEWEQIKGRYKTALDNLLTAKLASAEDVKKSNSKDPEESTKTEIPVITISDDNDGTAMDVSVASANVDDKNSIKKSADGDANPENAEMKPENVKPTPEAEGAALEAAVVVNPVSSITDKDEPIADGLEQEPAVQPTHFSQLDPKNMKVTELRAELNARNLLSKGLKNQLIARLVKALQAEADPASSNGEEADESEDVEMTETEPVEPSSSQESEKVSVEPVTVEQPEDASEKPKDEIEHEISFAEMDISEVTIIDEYDSTKCDDEKVSKKKDELPRKERYQWEKRYHLPAGPQIVVHPSKTAKSGKFDATVMSLSLLLDYVVQDTKEHSFEVSLFAELFNEMLMRDFGFNIYKALSVFPAMKDEEKKDLKEIETKKESESDAGDKKKAEIDISNEDIKLKDKDRKRHHEDSDDSVTTRSDRSRSKRDGKDLKETQVVERVKQITVCPNLLLSFVYFDQSHCGYIFEKDLEELFYAIGLNLSRSQARKIIEKFITRESLYYRKLTDRPIEVEFVNPLDSLSDEKLKELACGNQIKKISLPSKTADGQPSNVDSTGLVQFNGSLVNIQQLLDQMKRSEAARENVETLLVDLKRQNAELTIANNRNEKRNKELQSDMKSVVRNLQTAENSLSSATRRYCDYLSVLQTIHDRVAPIIQKNEKSRDRERNERKKESEKADKDKSEKSDKSDKEKDRKTLKTESKEAKDISATDIKKESPTSTPGFKEEPKTEAIAAIAEQESDNTTVDETS